MKSYVIDALKYSVESFKNNDDVRFSGITVRSQQRKYGEALTFVCTSKSATESVYIYHMYD